MLGGREGGPDSNSNSGPPLLHCAADLCAFLTKLCVTLPLVFQYEIQQRTYLKGVVFI